MTQRPVDAAAAVGAAVGAASTDGDAEGYGSGGWAPPGALPTTKEAGAASAGSVGLVFGLAMELGGKPGRFTGCSFIRFFHRFIHHSIRGFQPRYSLYASKNVARFSVTLYFQ